MIRNDARAAEVRRYKGPVKGLVLDWSGTVADAYVIAPAIVFVDVFRRAGVTVSMAEARGPMGLRKDLHIKEMIETPEISRRWQAIHGRAPTQGDVDALYADFIPLQLEVLKSHTALLPGVAAVTQAFQARGIKIGASTGFSRAMVDVLLKDAIVQGFRPDATVGGDEVLNGARPAPFMLYRNLDLMGVSPIQSVVKVDDTTSGIGEAINAGCWGVGIARYSNYMDFDTLEEAAGASADDVARRLAATREKLLASGAHYVIDEFHELTDVVKDIEARLAAGETP